MRCGFAYTSPYALGRGLPSPRLDYLPASPHRLPTTGSVRALPPARPKVCRIPNAEHHRVQHGRSFAGTGISTRCPSTTPVGLALGPDLPRANSPCPGTLGHSAEEFLTPHSLLMPAFSLVCRPRLGYPAASFGIRRSPTHPYTWPDTLGWTAGYCTNATASVVCLSPVTLSAQNHLTSELLRTL